MGPNAPVKLRSQVSTHAGFIQNLLQPYHVVFECDSLDELTADVVSKKLKALIGTSTTSESNPVKVQPKSAEKPKVGPAVVSSAASAQKVGISVENDDEFKAALHDLHYEKPNVSWLIASYVSANTLKMIAQGSGDVQEFVGNFQDDKMNYGLLRVQDLV